MNKSQSQELIALESSHAPHAFPYNGGGRERGIAQTPRTIVEHKAKTKDESPLALGCAWLVEHQIGISANVLLLLVLTYAFFPEARRHCRKFVVLSYYNQESGAYTIGWDDGCLVLYWIVVITGLRAFCMDYLLLPFAQFVGVQKKKDLTRFAEQAWLLMYCMVFWPLGMYIMYHSDYWLNLRNLWANWPNREIGGLLKWYILAQFAFWVQQIGVINIEKRRKDYWQMFAHHIITCGLLLTSYGYHQTKVANVILCLMDVVDLFFPAAKCLRYLGFTKLCDVFFGLFMASWIIARHVLYMIVCYSVWKDIPIEIAYGCYKGKQGELIGPFSPGDGYSHLFEPFHDPEGTVCFNHRIKWGFLTGLLSLQVLMIIWFSMICKVAAKVLKGGQADDSRSDHEDEEEVEESEPIVFEKLGPTNVLPLKEEVGVEALNLRRHGSGKRSRKSISNSSGATLPGYSDNKEFLRRIGCDKGI